jgi:hypothetical protein
MRSLVLALLLILLTAPVGEAGRIILLPEMWADVTPGAPARSI